MQYQKVIDEDHGRFGQVGKFLFAEPLKNSLNFYHLEFEDGERERFLAYQIDSYNETKRKETGYELSLVDLVKNARKHNQDLRFGQLLFNALSLHDKTNYDDQYDANFHSRLFYIEDTELATAISEWYEFVETYKVKEDTSAGLLHESGDDQVEG